MGTASIPARDFDLKGTAALMASAAADAPTAFELPFVVQGPWADPLVWPDPQILINRSGAAAPLLDAVRQAGSRAGHRIGDRTTGQRHPAGRSDIIRGITTR